MSVYKSLPDPICICGTLGSGALARPGEVAPAIDISDAGAKTNRRRRVTCAPRFEPQPLSTADALRYLGLFIMAGNKNIRIRQFLLAAMLFLVLVGVSGGTIRTTARVTSSDLQSSKTPEAERLTCPAMPTELMAEHQACVETMPSEVSVGSGAVRQNPPSSRNRDKQEEAVICNAFESSSEALDDRGVWKA